MDIAHYAGSQSLSPGVSADADRIADLMESGIEASSSSVTLGRPVALEQLKGVVCEWQREHGVGDNSLIDAYIIAQRFIKGLPYSIPDPDVEIDPEGEVSLDWSKGPRQCFAVSIGSEGQLAFAGLFGYEPVYGQVYFADLVPQPVIEGICRVLS